MVAEAGKIPQEVSRAFSVLNKAKPGTEVWQIANAVANDYLLEKDLAEKGDKLREALQPKILSVAR